MPTTSVVIPPGNLWGAMKQFYERGGFVNGLNPGIVGRVWYVDTINGSDGNSGRGPGQGGAFATVARALEFVDSYDVISLSGVVREQVITPTGVYDVTIIGGANRPRQATSSGVPTGGGSTWITPLSPAATTPLLEIREQGWRLMNIFFAPVASSPCVLLRRVAGAAYKGASHASILGCKFAGGGASGSGVEDVGGCYNVQIDDCDFESLTGTAILNSGTAVAIPLQNRFTNNRLSACTTGISGSYTQSHVIGNIFRMTADDGAVPKINMKAVSAQGSLNFVLNNYFPDVTADITIAKGYTPAANDVWRNFSTNSAAAIVTVPS